ncbi:MAG: hypothetical protein HQM06_12775, partial [Magnetococcales bacterium]|nr:hypothetical protein [Magnetococcales bacterium]
QSGITGADGSFFYLAGETVTFAIGGIVLGQSSGKALITPLDLGRSADTVSNIIRLLQSLDSDHNPANGISISAAVRSAADAINTINVTDPAARFAGNVALENFLSSQGGAALISASSAWDHFLTSLSASGGISTLSSSSVNENSGLAQTFVVGTLSSAAMSHAIYGIVGGADAALFTIEGNQLLIPAGTLLDYEGRSDKQLQLQIVAIDASGQLVPHLQSLTLTLNDVNEAPLITSNGGLASAELIVAEQQTVVTTVTSSDVDGGAVPGYAIIGGEDAARFVIDGQSGALAFAAAANHELPTDLGMDNHYTLIVQVSDGQLIDQQVLTITVSNQNDLPTGLVTLTGTAAQYAPLSALSSLMDEDGLGVLHYQWQVSADGSSNWSDIAGATSASYIATQSEVNHFLRVVVSYTDLSLATPESVTSAVSTQIANVNDPPTGLVSFSGTAAQYSSLSASNTLADLDGMGTVSYQWQVSADGVSGWSNLSSATGSSYTLTQAETGHYLRVVASYNDQLASAESVASLAPAYIVNINDAPAGTVTVSGTAAQYSTLNASNTLTDLDGMG